MFFFWLRSLLHSGAQPLRAGLLIGRRREAGRRRRHRRPAGRSRSEPTPQHMLPQQVAVPMQMTLASQGGGAHVPPPQNGRRRRADVAALAAVERIVLEVHAAPPQHMRPVVHSTVQTPPPPVPAVPGRAGCHRSRRRCPVVPPRPAVPVVPPRPAVPAPPLRRRPSCRPGPAAAGPPRRCRRSRRAAARSRRRRWRPPRRRCPSLPPAPCVPAAPVVPPDRRRRCRCPSRYRTPTARRGRMPGASRFFTKRSRFVYPAYLRSFTRIGSTDMCCIGS